MERNVKGQPIITLTTDFGLRDDYVGTVKGVLLSNCKATVIIDLTHGIEAQNIAQAAMSIGHSYRFFPPGTVHMVVVDPGVGTTRRILALRACGHIFVAPDNGVLTPFLDPKHFQDAFILSNTELFAATVSKSFHGRDIIAPVAARLACGMDISLVGPQQEMQQCSRINLPQASIEDGKIVGEIIHIDHFGNLRTSITAKDIDTFLEEKVRIVVGVHSINAISTTYSDTEAGNIIALFDSRNYLEIAVNRGSAAELLGCRTGDEITVSGPSVP